jgi:hypothetical protein
MAVVNLGTLHIDNPQLANKSLHEIKAFVIRVLESDLVSSMSPSKEDDHHWDTIDAALHNLKVTKPEVADDLERSLDFLGREARKSGSTDYKTARDEYLAQRYGS